MKHQSQEVAMLKGENCGGEKRMEERMGMIGERTRRRSIRRMRSPYLIKSADGADYDESEEITRRPGSLSQYACVDLGYTTATTTIKCLPVGSYRLVQYRPGAYVFNPVNVGSDDLMEFPDTKSGELVSEIEDFWELKPAFRKHGFRHKRGYLLWGPPGSGKSCTVNLVIRRMVERGGVVILASNPDALAYCLKEFREVEPNRPLVVVWEDFDECVKHNGPAVALSILDGDNQVDNVVFIGTTNYPERLDSRFLNRPNRFDRIIKIDMPSAEARAMFLRNRAGDTMAPDGTDLVKASEGFSFAHLKELVVGVWCQGFAVDGVLERLRKMKYMPKSSENTNTIGFTDEGGCIVQDDDDAGEDSEVNII